MKVSNKTIQYSIYDRTEGGNPVFVTDTTKLKRPDIATLTETLKGSGIMGEIDFPTMGQIGSMGYEITFKRTNKRAVVLFGQKTQHFETRWVTDVFDTANAKIGTCANKEIVKAIPKSIGLGEVESNSTNETTVALEVIYYKYIQDGETLIEIDKLNNVFIIDGWDYYSGIREAL